MGSGLKLRYNVSWITYHHLILYQNQTTHVRVPYLRHESLCSYFVEAYNILIRVGANRPVLKHAFANILKRFSLPGVLGENANVI